MSVLLDALKKAAAEKKVKEAEKKQVSSESETRLDTSLIQAQSTAAQPEPDLRAQTQDFDSDRVVETAQSDANKQIKSPSVEADETSDILKLVESATELHVVPPPVEPITKPTIESKFKLADAELKSAYLSTSSNLMDVLGETQDGLQNGQNSKNNSVEITDPKPEKTNPSATKPNQNPSTKQSELEALFKPGNRVSEKQRVLQSKQVKKLFSPALTTTMKPIKSSMSRKLYLFFLGLSVLVAVLIYYALFIFQDLEQQYDRQVHQFTSTIERPVQKTADEPIEAIVDEPQVEPVANKRSDDRSIKPASEASAVQAKKPTSQGSASEKPVSQSTTRPGSSVQVKRVDKTDENKLAYEAYLNSDFEQAEYHYRRGLAQNPNSKNSQIGLAALAAQRRDYQQAMSYYQRVLQQNPEDEDALQGIASIAAELSNQEAMLNDLVGLARRYPDSATLQFALGNQYAQRQDWFKAQQHYFDSVRLEQNNPDYRLNLAVSFDHLGQFKDALEHYKHSLALAESHSATQFNAAAVYQRINVLQRFLEQN